MYCDTQVMYDDNHLLFAERFSVVWTFFTSRISGLNALTDQSVSNKDNRDDSHGRTFPLKPSSVIK